MHSMQTVIRIYNLWERDEEKREGREFFYKLRRDLEGYGNEQVTEEKEGESESDS